MFLKKNWEKIVLVIILGLASFLRLWDTFHGSFAYVYDIGRDLLAVRRIVVDHQPTLLGPTAGIEGIFYGPWWYYFLSFPFFIFQGNPTGIAAFIGLIGILTVFLSFILGKKIWGASDKLWPLVLAGVIAFSRVHVQMSTQIWSPNLVPALIILWFLSLLAFWQEKRWPLFFVGFFSALILEFEVAFGAFFIVSQVVIGGFLFRKNLSLRKVFLFFLGLFLVFSPRLLFDLRHDFLATKNIFYIFGLGGLISGERGLLFRFQERSQAFLGTWNNTLANGHSFLGLLFLGLTVVSLLLFRSRLAKKERQLASFLIFIIFSLYLLFSLYAGDFWWYYLVGLPIVYSFLFVLALRCLASLLSQRLFLLVIIVYFIFLIQPKSKIFESLKNPYWEGDPSVYRHLKAVVEEVFQHADGEPFRYLVYTPPLHPYTYQYLFTWLSERRYHNPAREEHQRWFYLIVEPDIGREDLPGKWLAQYQNDGLLIEEKKMAGNILLQIREWQ